MAHFFYVSSIGGGWGVGVRVQPQSFQQPQEHFVKMSTLMHHRGGDIAELVERRTRDRQVADLTPGRQEGRANFLFESYFSVLTLMWCLFHSGIPQQHVNRPWLFCQKCRWQVTVKHASPLNQQSRSRLTMEPARETN